MAGRIKEDEKNERIIRGLLRLQENRRCMNCNSLGPQYVCTNFMTFVCTNCSGIHREFTHRVKSISMAKFTSQEVGALQAGGNLRAREIYLKEWDPQRHSTPDSSNVDRLRDFIKHVFVDKRYTGERSLENLPQSRMGDRENLYDRRKTNGSQLGSQSPYDRHYSGKNSPGGRSDDRNSRDSYEKRSPGYDSETLQVADHRKSPARPEIVNDWRRDDRFANEKKFEGKNNYSGDSKFEGRSPEMISSPPVIRPVRDILGDSVSLRIIEPPKSNNTIKANDGLPDIQRAVPSSNLGSINGNLVQSKSTSLIDFDADPVPPVSVAAPHTHQTVPRTVSDLQASSNNQNWASFDVAPQSKSSNAPLQFNNNSLESVLSELSVPASLPTHNTFGVSPPGLHIHETDNSFVKATDVGQRQNMQHQHQNFFPTQQPFAREYNPIAGGLSNQGLLSTSGQQPPFVQANSNVGTPLPEELFATNYSHVPASAFGLQTGPQHAATYNNTNAANFSFPQSSRSTNPFDIIPEPSQPSMFPSMVSLQAALPNISHHPSSLYSSLPPHLPSYMSNVPPRAFMGHQVTSDISARHQVAVNHGTELPPFGLVNPNPGLLQTSNPVSGNPFM